MIELEQHDRSSVLRLNNPQKRNALSLPMFDALDRALDTLEGSKHVQGILLIGNGSAFCAGFDLTAAQSDPQIIATFITRLSLLCRRLRRMDPIVIAAVHGAAVAGGCALVSACDFVMAAPNATLGYPVHQLGISPAVTIPTLRQRIGCSPARAILTSGELITGVRAHEIGLVTHIARSIESLEGEAMALLRAFAEKPPHALKVTKRWLNELDGSLDDAAFDGPANASAALAGSDETQRMLIEHWKARAAKK